jgi:hypothetical protein
MNCCFKVAVLAIASLVCTDITATDTLAASWFVNFGSYSRESTAYLWAKRLQPLKGKVMVISVSHNGQELYRTRVVALASQQEAETVARQLEAEFGLSKLWVGAEEANPVREPASESEEAPNTVATTASSSDNHPCLPTWKRLPPEALLSTLALVELPPDPSEAWEKYAARNWTEDKRGLEKYRQRIAGARVIVRGRGWQDQIDISHDGCVASKNIGVEKAIYRWGTILLEAPRPKSAIGLDAGKIKVDSEFFSRLCLDVTTRYEKIRKCRDPLGSIRTTNNFDIWVEPLAGGRMPGCASC